MKNIFITIAFAAVVSACGRSHDADSALQGIRSPSLDLTGAWFQKGELLSPPTDIVQEGDWLVVTVADKVHSARFISQDTLHLDTKVTGKVEGNHRIVWSDGSFWTRKPDTSVIAYVGDVENHAGFFYSVEASGKITYVSSKGWNECPEAYVLTGGEFQVNGFWVCMRRDLLDKEVQFGDVTNDRGAGYLLKRGAETKTLGAMGWNTCGAGQTYLGREFHIQGFWLCMN